MNTVYLCKVFRIFGRQVWSTVYADCSMCTSKRTHIAVISGIVVELNIAYGDKLHIEVFFIHDYIRITFCYIDVELVLHLQQIFGEQK